VAKLRPNMRPEGLRIRKRRLDCKVILEGDFAVHVRAILPHSMRTETAPLDGTSAVSLAGEAASLGSPKQVSAWYFPEPRRDATFG
jgi:hypothetical protein